MLRLLAVLILFLSAASFAEASELRGFLSPPFKPLPHLEFIDAEGNTHTSKQWQGKVVLLNFWATWCQPCVQEMPALGRLEKLLGGKKFTVLPISVDQKKLPELGAFFTKHGITDLPIYLAKDKDIFPQLGLQALPTTYILDTKGEIRARIEGPLNWESEEVIQAIQKVMGEE